MTSLRLFPEGPQVSPTAVPIEMATTRVLIEEPPAPTADLGSFLGKRETVWLTREEESDPVGGEIVENDDNEPSNRGVQIG